MSPSALPSRSRRHQQSLDQLAQELRARAAELDDADQALAVVDLARNEAAKESPNQGTLLGLLKTLGSVVAGVATLGTSVSSIVAAVSAISSL